MSNHSLSACTVLNNGLEMPWLGFGVFGVEDGKEAERVVGQALKIGYRSIDTATIYKNERGVGKAIRDSGISRAEIFLTTKVWNEDQRLGRTTAAFDESLERLGTDYVDLYLVHWPVEGCCIKTWSDMEAIYDSGRARAIGVSNFMEHHLQELLSVARIIPAVNQVEFHPFLVQADLLKFCRDRQIQTEAWSPLMSGKISTVPEALRLAEKYQKTPAQIVLRWDLQHDVVSIPKTSNAERMVENASIFDFELSQDDMRLLDALDVGMRIGPDPHSFDF